MKVQNMKSRSGNKIANQFIITNDDTGEEWFQSYDSIIVKINRILGKKQVLLDKTYWDYSRTTSKYRNMFLCETTKEIKDKIKSGEYILADLN